MGAKLLLVLAALLLHDRAVGQTWPIRPDWVLVRHPLKWESPPREPKLNKKIAQAEIIVLNPSGAFATVFCFLIRQKDGAISISRGDSHTVSVARGRKKGSPSRFDLASCTPMDFQLANRSQATKLKVTSRHLLVVVGGD